MLQAIERGEAVAVYGDYDVDGITATCLVTDYLRSRGLRVHPYIPDRNEEGYGLNCSALESLRAEGVSLLITVDCGITAVEESEFGRSLGMDMVITDHHECKDGELPDAVAVVSRSPDRRRSSPRRTRGRSSRWHRPRPAPRSRRRTGQRRPCAS